MTSVSAKCFLTLLVATCIGTAGSLVFQSTSCSSTESLIVRLYGVSFSTCAEECERRPKCSLYNYRPGLHSCELLSKNGNETAETIGCVVGLKPTTSVRKFKCSPKKDGDSAGEPGHKKECPPLSVPRATVFGNVWTIGSKAAVICHSYKTYFTTKCQEDGTWEDVPKCPVCPPDWIMKGSSCYISTGTNGNYSVAEQKCKSLHESAHLAYITTQDEKQNLQTITWRSNRLWIGGQLNDDGEWRWGDESLIPDWGWRQGDPDSNRDKSCMIVLIQSDGYWKKRKCSTEESGGTFGGLCEIDLPQNVYENI